MIRYRVFPETEESKTLKALHYRPDVWGWFTGCLKMGRLSVYYYRYGIGWSWNGGGGHELTTR